ncbi:hypothetical protein BH11PSE11_BH11PSE11_27420 [soil metagenome]
MSYILDALRKSESERARGTVPGIHAQSNPVFAESGGTMFRRRRLAWVACVAVIVAIAMAGVYAWLTAAQSPSTAISSTSTHAHTEPAMNPEPQSMPERSPQQMAGKASQADNGSKSFSAVSTAQAAIGKPRLPEPARTRKMPKRETDGEPKAASTRQAKPPVSDDASAIAKPLAVESTLVETGVGTRRDLPANVQSEVPAVAFGGYIYTSNPSGRSVVVSNRLLREGDLIAPGLTLEKMLPKEAILNYMGHRFRVPY